MISFGYCTQIGIDSFTGFATQPTKSRLNFLYLLRAGQGGYVVNSAALYYMRRRALAGPLIERPACAPTTRLVDHADWQAHLRHLGIEELAVPQHPAGIATDGAIWGAISAHGMLDGTAIVSDGAGQFAVGRHALCWVHADRLVHKLETFTATHRAAQARMRACAR